MNDMTFPPALIDELAKLADLEQGASQAIRLRLDLAGYDSDDEALFRAASRAAQKRLEDQRLMTSIMGRFCSMMLTNKEIGEILGGIAKSSVQGLAVGRLRERYTAQQRHAFRALLEETIAGCKDCLKDL